MQFESLQAPNVPAAAPPQAKAAGWGYGLMYISDKTQRFFCALKVNPRRPLFKRL